MATHADEALRLLAYPTTRERAVLSAFGYSRNETYLHADESCAAAGDEGQELVELSPARL